MLGCKCGSLAVEVTDAEESRDENGFVTSFKEEYGCNNCDRTGEYHFNEDGPDRLTGCLTQVDGGAW